MSIAKHSNKISLKEAIKEAKNQIRDVFELEEKNVFLEEIATIHDGGWNVTISFFEDAPPENVNRILYQTTGHAPKVKRYKIVSFDKLGEVQEIKSHHADF